MPKTRSNKTGFSTDAASLADLQDQAPHPFLDLLLQHRDATKLKQIIETLERGLGGDGRIRDPFPVSPPGFKSPADLGQDRLHRELGGFAFSVGRRAKGVNGHFDEPSDVREWLARLVDGEAAAKP